MSQPALFPRDAMPERRGDSLADLLERVLDKGVVIAGDVVVNLLDIELLTLKIRLLVSSVDTARSMGIDWWESDPFLSSAARQRALEPSAAAPVSEDPLETLRRENRDLQQRLSRLEAALPEGASGSPSARSDAAGG